MEKRNIPYIVSYILEILLILLGAVFYRQPLLSVLLLLLLILPPFSLMLTKREFDALTVGISCNQRETTRGGKIHIRVAAEYRGFVPLLNCRLLFTFENRFYPHLELQELVFPAEAKREGAFTLPFEVSKAGMVDFSATKLYVTDFLHLYTFAKPINLHLQIPVLPEDVPAPPFSKQRVFADADEIDPEEIASAGGEKTRDLKQLREYRAGDRLKDIHWKLTAKTDDLLIREYEETKELYFLLLPVLDDEHLQETLEVFLAIGKELLKEREPFTAAIFHPADGTFSLKTVTEEESLFAALFALYLEPVEGYETAHDRFLSRYPSAGGLICVADGKVAAK